MSGKAIAILLPVTNAQPETSVEPRQIAQSWTEFVIRQLMIFPGETELPSSCHAPLLRLQFDSRGSLLLREYQAR